MNKTHARLPGWRVVLFLLILPLSTLVLVISRSLPGTVSAAAWSVPVTISNYSPPTNYGSYGPDLVYDSQGYGHAVWYGNGEVGTQWGIWYANNRSGNWSTAKRLFTEGNLRFPRMAIDTANGLHVVYEDQGSKEIMYAYSSNYGQTWSKVNISNSPAAAYEPDVAVDADGNVHAVWIDNRWAGVYHLTYSKKTGGSWSAPVSIPTPYPADFNKGPGVATTGSGSNMRVHIALYGKHNGAADNTYEVYYIRGTGTSWDPGRNLSNTGSTASYDPSITASGTSIYVAWDESTTSHDIRTVASHDNGANWSSQVHVTSDTGRSRFPSIFFGLGKAQIVYDSDTFSPNKGDIFYTNYDPGSGSVAAPTNLSNSSAGDSQLAVVYADACKVGSAWQESANSKWNIYYAATPCGPAPTPVPTQAPNPHGWVDIRAHDPLNSSAYTRLTDVTLLISATSDVGSKITDMKVCNEGASGPGACNPPAPPPTWIAFAQAMPNWELLPPLGPQPYYHCGWKQVNIWFKDAQGRESNVYADYIRYDDFATATMSLNGGQAYANQTMVMVTSQDREAAADSDCVGLRDMRLKETGLTYTVWISYYPELYFFLAPGSASPRAVEAEYRDRANNYITLSDSIMLDLVPPYNCLSPTLNGGAITATHHTITVTDFSAKDDESGVAHVWLANRSTGPWKIYPYTSTSILWDLFYGGPPTVWPGIHHVYARYEDGAGFASFPGNLSSVCSSPLHFMGSNVYLPLVDKKYTKKAQVAAEITASTEVNLTLMSKPLQTGPGQDVLLWLAAQRDQDGTLDGTLRMTLPEGLRVVRAWSAYGQLLQTGDHLVVSHERASPLQVSWILVHARVEPGAAAPLQVQGEMTWGQGSTSRAPTMQVQTD